MHDVVAVKVVDSKRRAHFILTWGRIFDRVGSKSLEDLVAKRAQMFGIKSPKVVIVCDSLKEASQARYFYEAFFHFSQKKIPFGVSTYERWGTKIRRQMASGQHLFYCGTSGKRT
jgi:hypothetical protein